jgi:hypothetical protein
MEGTMRKVVSLTLAILLAAALAAAGSHAAEKKKLATQIEIENYELNGEVTFIGDVHSKKNKCERRRSVTIRHVGSVGPDIDETLGTVTTDQTGDYVLEHEFDGIDSGPYVADVERKKIKKGDKKLVCKAATSGSIELVP